MKKRFTALITALTVLLLCLPAVGVSAEAAYDFEILQGYYKTQGRVNLNGTALEMDTTSSGFEFYFEGSGDVTLSAEVWCNYSTDLYLTVIVDGVRSRLPVDAGSKGTTVSKTLTLASGLSDGLHHIEVYKQSEAIVSGFAAQSLCFTGVPVSTPAFDKITMEVVGDSISSGASMWSADADPTIPADYPYFLDGTKTYAYLAGEALGANVRVTQASGYGCVAGFNSDGLNLQDLFAYTNYWRSSTALYAFDPTADIVVINLGTNDGMSGKVTAAQFEEGVTNLMTLARQKNPHAKIVWCTGMMGTFFPEAIQAAVTALGGSEQGYFYCELPYGVDGGYGHPNVAQHEAAAAVLKDFLLENCLPAEYRGDFATAAQLQAALDAARAVASPSATLQAACKWAQAELDWGTTDEYRLGVRLAALQTALDGETKLDLMPRKTIATCPMEANGSYIWPYYGAADGTVTLYKGGEGYYWPHTEVLQDAVTVNVNETPLLRIVTDGTAYFNVHITYKDTTGAVRVVTASELGDNGAVDFSPGSLDLTLDFGAYVNANGHADANGYVPLLACDVYASGEMDTYTTVKTLALVTGDEPAVVATEISGSYPVADGVVSGIAIDTTAAQLIAAMEPQAYLQVLDQSGGAAQGALATGMSLALIVRGETVQQLSIAVFGDVDGNGEMNTSDCREVLLRCGTTFDGTIAQFEAADYDDNGTADTRDARAILLDCLL